MATLPKGPNLIAPGCIDTASSNGACTYPPQAIATLFPTVGIFVNKAPCFIGKAGVPVDIVPGVPNQPLAICLPLPRQLVNTPKGNTSVFFNKILPIVTPGDNAVVEGGGNPRALVGPILAPNIFIGSSGKKKKS